MKHSLFVYTVGNMLSRSLYTSYSQYSTQTLYTFLLAREKKSLTMQALTRAYYTWLNNIGASLRGVALFRFFAKKSELFLQSSQAIRKSCWRWQGTRTTLCTNSQTLKPPLPLISQPHVFHLHHRCLNKHRGASSHKNNNHYWSLFII